MSLSTGALVAVAVLAVVTEPVPPDITAVGVLVALAVLEPYTGVAATDAIAGFASPAVVTVIGMSVLSKGGERAGVVDWLGARLGRATRGGEGGLHLPHRLPDQPDGLRPRRLPRWRLSPGRAAAGWAAGGRLHGDDHAPHGV